MKKLLLALALLLIPVAAQAQCNGIFQAGTVCGVGNAESARPPHQISIGATVTLITGTTQITGGTSLGILYNNATLLGNTNSVNGALLNTGTTGIPSLTKTPVIGVPGTTTGTLGFGGITSGTATITPQATAGSPTLTLPNASGTFAVNASAPLVLSATTGALTCPTCSTSSGGGAVTGVAPVAVSAAGAVSITGVDGAVLTGSGPSFSQTPTLGTAGASAGSLAFANATSGSVTVQTVAGALGSRTISLPAASGTVAVSATAPITLSAAGDIGITSPLPLTNGGSAAALTASNGGLVYSTGAALAILSGTATANQIPLSGSSTTPAWSTATYPATAAAGTVLAAASANVVAATTAPTLGANGGTGGSVAFNGSTSGSATVRVAAIAGTATNFQLPASNGVGGQVLQTDGSGNTSWASAAAGGTVTSVQLTAGTGIGVATTSGANPCTASCNLTLSTAITSVTNSLSGNVALNSANFFTGPTVAQGTSGTWFASGTVTLSDSAGAATVVCKLWDGTTVIASTTIQVPSGQIGSVSLSGLLTNPATNISIACRDLSSTSGLIRQVSDGTTSTANASTLSAVRLQ